MIFNSSPIETISKSIVLNYSILKNIINPLPFLSISLAKGQECLLLFINKGQTSLPHQPMMDSKCTSLLSQANHPVNVFNFQSHLSLSLFLSLSLSHTHTYCILMPKYACMQHTCTLFRGTVFLWCSPTLFLPILFCLFVFLRLVSSFSFQLNFLC